MCSRSSYCSKDCQIKDWRSGHKEWCGLDYGIEGIDWEIKQASPTKGKGIFARRRFEPDERIMVERLISSEQIAEDAQLQNAVMQLEPTKGVDRYRLRSSEEESSIRFEGEIAKLQHPLNVKYAMNSIGSIDDRGDFGGVCIRMARANHACDPNASTYFDEETGHMVLHAGRVIEAGEEICISYTDGMDPTCYGGNGLDFDPVRNKALEQHAARLREQYEIVCGDDCACKSGPKIVKLRTSKLLEAEMMRHALQVNFLIYFFVFVRFNLHSQKYFRVTSNLWFVVGWIGFASIRMRRCVCGFACAFRS